MGPRAGAPTPRHPTLIRTPTSVLQDECRDDLSWSAPTRRGESPAKHWPWALGPPPVALGDDQQAGGAREASMTLAITADSRTESIQLLFDQPRLDLIGARQEQARKDTPAARY